MSLLAVSEAALRLGVSTRQVQNLVAQGELRQLARGVIDEASVERLAAVRRGSHRRAWSEVTAWGAVDLLSGGTAQWMGARQCSRMKERLRGLDALELVERSRGRARVSRYRAHSSARTRLMSELVTSADAETRLGLVGGDRIDGYVEVDAADGLVERHGLIRDDDGSVVIRATTFDLSVIRELAGRGTVLAALDLAESLDIRERRAGVDGLDAALRALRG
jgi:hypothetical protein